MALVLKIGFAVLCLAIWLATQKWIGSRKPQPEGQIHDFLHQLTEGWNRYLNASNRSVRFLLISSSFFVDALGVFLIASAIFGPSLRPLIGLFMIFGLRQLNQAVTLLPPPRGMIWRDPGFPSALVTYGVSQDLFFSGHTALSVFGALELMKLGGAFVPLGILVAIYEIVTVIALRAHWTMDVFAGAVTALWINEVAGRAAPFVDTWISGLARF